MNKEIRKKNILSLPFYKYSVYLVDDLGGKVGQCDLVDKVITISMNSINDSTETPEEILIHEIVHGILYECGLTRNSTPKISDEDDETLAMILGKGIAQNIDKIIELSNYMRALKKV